ncbi:uncharacterized protein TRIADDRAFT_62635 [Trichoplax adhaerens]|uniref:MARVEL domain-containing protein n=1 Tax=Trichoplax adhaerens TaxID=10228 RepID=B3SEE4_TRIAD|nr:hypothetical protein TRIADDRAFT_62635 [Trichoplax adhaerens]EDV18901.1 hypothetical protein TRIADDRAFT_62635 [Trichoplax adhaerens]|eukprot:XP_002118614.1 hypothetical protein TRIADDRAFT_62635 [Trichoplax adhaerens]
MIYSMSVFFDFQKLESTVELLWITKTTRSITSEGFTSINNKKDDVVDALAEDDNSMMVRNSARNGRVLKEPKGFMRIIQWFVAILAFGTATSFSVMTAVTISCGGSVRNETATLKFSYPFASGSLTYASPACNSSGSSSNRTEFVELGSNISASVQFFVFVGVISFLYTLISLGIYVFKIDPANPPEREPYFKVDFVISVIFVIFWIAGAGAWAAA